MIFFQNIGMAFEKDLVLETISLSFVRKMEKVYR